MPCEFVGAAVGQQAVYLDGEAVSNHDELMSNFFAQVSARTPAEDEHRYKCATPLS